MIGKSYLPSWSWANYIQKTRYAMFSFQYSFKCLPVTCMILFVTFVTQNLILLTLRLNGKKYKITFLKHIPLFGQLPNFRMKVISCFHELSVSCV